MGEGGVYSRYILEEFAQSIRFLMCFISRKEWHVGMGGTFQNETTMPRIYYCIFFLSFLIQWRIPSPKLIVIFIYSRSPWLFAWISYIVTNSIHFPFFLCWSLAVPVVREVLLQQCEDCKDTLHDIGESSMLHLLWMLNWSRWRCALLSHFF